MKSKPVSPTAPIAVVVNDDPTQLSVLSALVLKAGLSPRSFTGAEAALADMTANAGILPVLIVTDLHMPGIDGWRFCRLLRSPEYAALNHVPILVVSATFVGAEPNRIATDLGAETFLSSPVDGKLFVEQVQAIVSKRQVQKPLRVLIVEDSKTLAGMLKKTFTANCYEADTAPTLGQASAAFSKTIYDVAVLDYHLPDGTGDELLDKFRAAQPDCVCLMMTTNAAPGLALDWMKRGAAAYLRKPFKPEYLIELCANARRERGLLRVQDLLEVRTRELRESEERYRGVFAGTPDGIIVHDAEGLILEANEAMAQRLELSVKKLQGRTIVEFITPDSAANIYNNARITLEGQTHVFETNYVSVSGKMIPAEVHESRIQWMNKQAVLSISRDITDRKQAEVALKESEERYRNLFENAQEAIFVIQDAKVVFLNPVAAPQLGYSTEDLLAKSFIDFIHPDDQNMVVVNHIRRLNGDDFPNIYSFRLIHKDGSVRWGELNSVLINWKGKPATMNFLKDITEHRQAEDALRESEKKYRWVIDNMADVITIIDMNLRLTYVSPSIIRMRGYTPEEATAQTFEQFMTPESLKIATQAFEEEMKLEAAGTADPGRRRILELEQYKKDGSTAWMEVSMSFMRDEAQKPVGIISVTRDITARRQAENTYRNIFLNSQIGLFRTEISTGLLLDANDAVARFVGYPDRASLLAEPFSIAERYVDPDDRQKMISLLQASGELKNFETRFRKNDGSIIWILFSARLVKEKGWLEGVSEDITERRQAQEDKAKLESQLQQAQKMESIGRLAGGVAHDFNNMLSVILGYSELAIKKAGADNPLQRHLAQILDAAQRSAALTRQLLAFARQQTIAPIVLDLNKTIEGMLKMLQRLIGEDIELKWHPKADLWPVKVDPSQIDQILANLCVNARDAIADVGKITIETENSTLDNSYCANHPGFAPGDYLRLTVSDDGYGMDKETQSKLFEPFFTTKEMGKGTGLGLATVYGIVKQNNGFINVYSEPGQGTSFTIYLLRHTADALQTRQAGPPRTATRGHETILLVEDEPAILEMAATMLEGQGYTVRAAVTPGEAIRLAREHKGEIELLVTDVVMPEMNGRDLAKNLMSLYPQLKRLFMSGYTANVIAHHGVLDEGVYFIQKPFSIKELSAKVREALDGNENSLSE